MGIPRSVACLVSFATLAVACGPSAPTNELRYAAAMFSCGPVDQPATVIVLSREPILSAQVPDAAVRITILEPVDTLAGRTWQIGDKAGAFYIVGGDGIVSATTGSVTVTRVDSTKRIDGGVNLLFSSWLLVTEFSAPWIETDLRCG